MNSIILILYFESDLNSVRMLNKLIDRIEMQEKKFLLTSHSPISSDIIRRSAGYIYDPSNPLYETTPELFFYKKLGDWVLSSPYLYYGSLSHRSHALASFTNILNGLTLARQLGYSIVHFVEYDCFPNFEDLTENERLIEGSHTKAIVYRDDEENSTMQGCVFTLSANDFLETRFSLDEIKKHFSTFNEFSEVAVYHQFKTWFGGNFILEKSKSIQPSHFQNEYGSILIESVLAEYDGKVFLFMISENSAGPVNIKFYSNTVSEEMEINPSVWIMSELGKKHEVDFVDIYINQKLWRRWEFASEENYFKYVGRNVLENVSQG